MITKEQLKKSLLEKYNNNKNKMVGSTCFCPICGQQFTKKTVLQAFCGTSQNTICKDAFHNFIRYGTTYNFGCFKELYEFYNLPYKK